MPRGARAGGGREPGCSADPAGWGCWVRSVRQTSAHPSPGPPRSSCAARGNLGSALGPTRGGGWGWGKDSCGRAEAGPRGEAQGAGGYGRRRLCGPVPGNALRGCNSSSCPWLKIPPAPLPSPAVPSRPRPSPPHPTGAGPSPGTTLPFTSVSSRGGRGGETPRVRQTVREGAREIRDAERKRGRSRRRRRRRRKREGGGRRGHGRRAGRSALPGWALP